MDPLRPAAILVALLSIPVLAPASDAQSAPASCPAPDANLATARASTIPLRVLLNGMELLATPTVSSDQTGPGNDQDSGLQAEFALPGGDPLVKAEILTQETSAGVTGSPLRATARGVSAVAHLDIGHGMVVADLVRSESTAVAEPRTARTDSLPSTIEGLRIDNEWYSYVEPGTDIPLPDAAFGKGSYVHVHERVDRSKLPTAESPFYKGEVQVRMIHVLLSDVSALPGAQKLEVIVAGSWAQARAPAEVCGSLVQSVKGGAYIGRVWPTGWGGPYYTAGNQKIGPTGGTAGQALVDQDFSDKNGGQTFTVETLKTTVNGKVSPGEQSVTKSTSEAQGLCLDYDGKECFVKATLIRTEANAVANPWAAYEWGSTVFVDLKIAGIDVCQTLGLSDPSSEPVSCRPPPNTRLDNLVPGLHITLNEQWGDPSSPGYVGLTVRAIRIESGDGFSAPGNVLVARSYAAAEYRQT